MAALDTIADHCKIHSAVWQVRLTYIPVQSLVRRDERKEVQESSRGPKFRVQEIMSLLLDDE